MYKSRIYAGLVRPVSGNIMNLYLHLIDQAILSYGNPTQRNIRRGRASGTMESRGVIQHSSWLYVLIKYST